MAALHKPERRGEERRRKRGWMRNIMFIVVVSVVMVVVVKVGEAQSQTSLVPAIITFGDSAVDVGNNDYLSTIYRADYPPYGRDFLSHIPTGRFCNGKLATDFTAELLGFTRYPSAYLSPQATGRNLLIGANFASAASGYHDKTSAINHAISLTEQLKNFREYETKLRNIAGNHTASSIVKEALYIVSAGSSDFMQSYYVNPFLYNSLSPDQFSSFLSSLFSRFVKELHGLGARRIGVTSLPPLGCLPAAITLFGMHNNGCVSRLNEDAQNFNKKLGSEASKLGKQLPGLKIVVFDIFNPLLDLINSPSNFGFAEARRGCCGTGRVETTVYLCNKGSVGTCVNATQYVFWDSVHPSESANRLLSQSLLLQGISLIS